MLRPLNQSDASLPDRAVENLYRIAAFRILRGAGTSIKPKHCASQLSITGCFRNNFLLLSFPDEMKADKFPRIVTGASPIGKAAGFDPAMRWFESSRPCHFLSTHPGTTRAMIIA
jgi:hypothetical protein